MLNPVKRALKITRHGDLAVFVGFNATPVALTLETVIYLWLWLSRKRLSVAEA